MEMHFHCLTALVLKEADFVQISVEHSLRKGKDQKGHCADTQLSPRKGTCYSLNMSTLCPYVTYLTKGTKDNLQTLD